LIDQPLDPIPAMARPTAAFLTQAPRLADMLAPERNSFGVIRLAMAIAVLFSHSYWFTTGSKLADPLVRFTGHSIGEHAVQVFFFLSGILVAASLLKSRSVLNYAVARALRIFPALIVCVLLTALVLGPMFTHGSLLQYFTDKQLPLYILKTLMLITGSAPLPHLFHDQPLPDLVNVSLWTLKYEVLCYFGLALIGAAGLINERLRPFTTALLAIMVAVVFIGQPKPLDTYTFIDNLRYFALYFYAGVLAYLLRDHVRVTGFALLPLAAAFWALVGSRFGELSCCLLLGYATLWVATFTFGPLRTFTTDHDYSYGVYIFAGPIQQLVISLLPDYGPTAVSLHALSIALPLAVFSWELIERPAIGMRAAVLALITRFAAVYLRLAIAAPLSSSASATPGIALARLGLATRGPRRVPANDANVARWPRSRPPRIVYRQR
jgi:peptidoglycan/LPS O-acetylase OafA/YrhL